MEAYSNIHQSTTDFPQCQILSAITESSSSNKCSTPLFLVKALSDMLPGKREETNGNAHQRFEHVYLKNSAAEALASAAAQ